MLLEEEAAGTQIGEEVLDILLGGRAVDLVVLHETGDQVVDRAGFGQSLPEETTCSVHAEVLGAFEVEHDELIADDVPREVFASQLHVSSLSRRPGPARENDPCCYRNSVGCGSLYELSPMEIALGWVFGPADEALPPVLNGVDPRTALEDAVLPSLCRPPCGVMFSGGRDSSAVLALATHVARREGLPDPIPITADFPGASRSRETEWQELVVSYLEIDDWQRFQFGDELDLVGPLADPLLREHGVIWSAMVHVDQPFLDFVAGGSLLTGEGGDEILGSETHRVHPVARAKRRRRISDLTEAKSVAYALAPSRVRIAHQRRHGRPQPSPWLKGPARDALRDGYASFERARPLPFSASIRAAAKTRGSALLARNRSILAQHRDVELSSPILDDTFVGALAGRAGVFGLGKRRDVLRLLVADLLPDSVLARSTKAFFDQAFLGERSRAFAESWSGRGLDSDLIDAEAVRAEWLSERPSGLTFPLLQAAWLASQADESAQSGEVRSSSGG